MLICISELEVQDVVQVKVTSDEDMWAVKTLNLVSAVDSLLQVYILLTLLPTVLLIN